MPPARPLFALLALVAAACSSPGPSSTVDLAAPPDMCPPVGGAPHSLLVKIALAVDGAGMASFFTQNGSMVQVPKASIAGKTFYWATAKGGEQIANAKMIDLGAGQMGADLTATWKTPANYPNGPWEMGAFISITNSDPTKGPQKGDLASFSLETPPPCQPPVTGVSVRMTVHDADATLTMTNPFFIRF